EATELVVVLDRRDQPLLVVERGLDQLDRDPVWRQSVVLEHLCERSEAVAAHGDMRVDVQEEPADVVAQAPEAAHVQVPALAVELHARDTRGRLREKLGGKVDLSRGIGAADQGLVADRAPVRQAENGLEVRREAVLAARAVVGVDDEDVGLRRIDCAGGGFARAHGAWPPQRTGAGSAEAPPSAAGWSPGDPLRTSLGRNRAGSTRALLRLTVQCKCGPVTRPVLPTRPMRSPRATRSPLITSTRLRWLYIVTTPCPWSSTTERPLKKKSPVSITTPAAGATIGVPSGAAMSSPLCGSRGSR